MDAPWRASSRSFSPSGTAVRPARRVTIRLWLTPGSVNSAPSAAAAPNRLDTPGVTSYSIPFAESASSCSRIAP